MCSLLIFYSPVLCENIPGAIMFMCKRRCEGGRESYHVGLGLVGFLLFVFVFWDFFKTFFDVLLF